MPGRALTPAGKIFKWVLVPIAMIAIGFFLVGAKIGRILPGLGTKATEPSSSSVAENGNASYSAPDVQVDSARGTVPPEVEVTSRVKPKHRRHREHGVPTVDTNAREPVEDYVAPASPRDSKHIGTGQ